MKRGSSAILAFTLSLVGFAAASNISPQSLPRECHPSFVKALERADKAYEAKDHQYAQALLKGILYPSGVTVKVDVMSAGRSAQNLERATERGVKEWNRVLDGQSPIRLIESNDTADFIIQMVDKLESSSPHALGLIKMKKSYSWNQTLHKVTNSGTISIVREWNDSSLSEDELAEVVCHELGHLLGLDDVSEMGNLMGPMDRGNLLTGPKPHEIHALKLLRAAAQQRLEGIQAGLMIKKSG